MNRPGDFFIRPARGEDVAPAAEIERLCFSEPWSEDSVGRLLANPVGIFLAAEENGRLLGYISANCPFETGYINNVAVHPGHRRRHVGERLLAALESAAAARGADLLTLEVRASNAPARGLYEKLGYRVIGRRPGFYQKPAEDALIMEKRLRGGTSSTTTA